MCCVFLQGKNTPLHLASRGGHADIIDILIRNGANINQTNIVSERWCIYNLLKTVKDTVCRLVFTIML